MWKRFIKKSEESEIYYNKFQRVNIKMVGVKLMKILVVRFKQIGDAIISSVICKTLKETYPDAEIDYVLYEHVASLFEKQKYINKVISLSKGEQKNIFKYLKRVWKETRREYDIVIDIMSTPKSEMFTLFSRGAKYRIGRYKKRRGYTYTHKVKEPPHNLDKAEKFLGMLKPLEEDGVDVKYTTDYSLEFEESELEDMRNRMINAGVDFSKLIIPLAITSRRPEKIYPKDLMLEVAKGLLDKYDCQLILYYSPAEKVEVEEFHKNLNYDTRVISNIDTKNIRELGVLFSLSDIFVGNEGGPRHLAQAVGKPTACIFCPKGYKKTWLSRGNPMHEALESREMGSANYEELSYDEKYRLIQPKHLLEIVEKVMKYVKK